MVDGQPGADRATEGYSGVREPFDAEGVGQAEDLPAQLRDTAADGEQGCGGAAVAGQVPADDPVVAGKAGGLCVPDGQCGAEGRPE